MNKGNIPSQVMDAGFLDRKWDEHAKVDLVANTESVIQLAQNTTVIGWTCDVDAQLRFTKAKTAVNSITVNSPVYINAGFREIDFILPYQGMKKNDEYVYMHVKSTVNGTLYLTEH